MGTRSNRRLSEAVLTSTHNLCFDQKYEKYLSFLCENFQFLEVKFSIYLYRRFRNVVSAAHTQCKGLFSMLRIISICICRAMRKGIFRVCASCKNADQSVKLHSLIMAFAITKTCLYNFDPLKPPFYIVKLGFTGIHYFSYFCWKI